MDQRLASYIDRFLEIEVGESDILVLEEIVKQIDPRSIPALGEDDANDLIHLDIRNATINRLAQLLSTMWRQHNASEIAVRFVDLVLIYVSNSFYGVLPLVQLVKALIGERKDELTLKLGYFTLQRA